MNLEYSLSAFEKDIQESIDQCVKENLVQKIWDHNHTVWKPEPTEITNRLGWLDIADRMVESIDEIESVKKSLKDEGYTHALLLGMGGSSLAPEVFRRTFGYSKSDLDLDILDSTDPEAVKTFADKLDPEKTVFIVSTKSGGTVETLSFFKYFYNWTNDALGEEKAGSHFIAITDPGSKLEELASNYQFRRTFINDSNIGGRFSALSFFGLVAAVFLGVDVKTLVQSAVDAGEAFKTPLNASLELGVILGDLTLKGRDKVTIISDETMVSFGDWAEQLIAESTGKEGKGILPVVGEPVFDAHLYGTDRIFIFHVLNGKVPQPQFKKALIEAGHPVLQINLDNKEELGGLFFIYEMATAIACQRLGINPFDQPNVESAKVQARKMTAAFHETGRLPEDTPAILDNATFTSFLENSKEGDYISIQIYTKSNEKLDKALFELRRKLTQKYNLATTIGYGPRFLHSTGQLHKGDSGNGLFIQFTTENPNDLNIPDEAGKKNSAMSFHVLKMSQALGDKQALVDENRRVIRFHVEEDLVSKINELTNHI